MCTFTFAISISSGVQQLNSVYELLKVQKFVQEQEKTEYIDINGVLKLDSKETAA